ncbi:MAG: AAA family ATPase [Fimbriiglobus sp.]
MTAPRLFVKSIIFNNGHTVTFNPDDIVIFVGANNAGKSATIKEIFHRSRNPSNPVQGHNMLRSVSLSSEGSIEEYKAWVEARYFPQPNSTPATYSNGEKHMRFDAYSGYNWESCLPFQEGDVPYVDYFWKSLDSRNRHWNDVVAHMVGSQVPYNPVQVMYENFEKEQRVSQLFQEAFGQELILNRFGGSHYPLHIGKRPEPTNNQNYFTPEFAKKIQDLPKLADQGSGMQSFGSLLISCLFDNDRSAIFIDEPEVYLHPPQARKLGSFLAGETTERTQLFIATHNGSFVRGLLDAQASTPSSRVRVIRIIRDDVSNTIHELNNEDIKRLWTDTVLRHSNVLDGLFHQRVIICESDTDCTFFAAVRAATRGPANDLEGDDVMFLSAGGKGRVSVMASALRSLGVKVIAAMDFDVLNTTAQFEIIVKSLTNPSDEYWSSLKKNYNIVCNHIKAKGRGIKKNDLLQNITKVFHDINVEVLSKNDVEPIVNLLNEIKPWSDAKKYGKGALPVGEVSDAWETLRSLCEQIGLHINPIGELESFCRVFKKKGSQYWVNKVLALHLATDPLLEDAREYVNRLFKD